MSLHSLISDPAFGTFFMLLIVSLFCIARDHKDTKTKVKKINGRWELIE